MLLITNLCLLVPGDILLATAFLSYSGPFNQEFRNLLLNDWQRELKQRRIPFGNNLNLTELLIDAPTVSEWNLQVSDVSVTTANQSFTATDAVCTVRLIHTVCCLSTLYDRYFVDRAAVFVLKHRHNNQKYYFKNVFRSCLFSMRSSYCSCLTVVVI